MLILIYPSVTTDFLFISFLVTILLFSMFLIFLFKSNTRTKILSQYYVIYIFV